MTVSVDLRVRVEGPQQAVVEVVDESEAEIAVATVTPAAAAEEEDPLTTPKEDGFYTVGVEIAPGTWESTGTEDLCYWAVLDQNQDIIKNHLGLAGGSVTISADAYEVQFRDCGTWEYRGPAE
jgi:hypothetical protein